MSQTSKTPEKGDRSRASQTPARALSRARTGSCSLLSVREKFSGLMELSAGLDLSRPRVAPPGPGPHGLVSGVTSALFLLSRWGFSHLLTGRLSLLRGAMEGLRAADPLRGGAGARRTWTGTGPPLRCREERTHHIMMRNKSRSESPWRSFSDTPREQETRGAGASVGHRLNVCFRKAWRQVYPLLAFILRIRARFTSLPNPAPGEGPLFRGKASRAARPVPRPVSP